MTPDLHDVVRALTEPTYEHVFQKSEGGESKVETVEHAPLFEQLRERFFPSSGSDGAGSKAALSARVPADLGAMYEYAKIAAQIGSWCRMIGLPGTRDAHTDLLAWHDKARGLLSPEQADWYRRTLTAWTNLIRNLLEPPESFVIERPCPVCRVSEWGDQINGGDRYPIEVRYRLDDTGAMVDHVARCRAPKCETVWWGREAVMELADELNEKTDPVSHDSRSAR